MSRASETAERQAIVDEFGEVKRQADLWKPTVNPHLKRLSELSAIIQGWYEKHPADQADLFLGASYQLEVKPCQFERNLTVSAIRKAFDRFKKLKIFDSAGKPAKFDPFTVFSVTQAAIKDRLGEPFLDEIAPKQRTGRRTFSVVPRAAAVPVKAA